MTTGAPGRIEAAFRGRLGGFSLDARFSVPATGVTAIFGPSGCGKTTVARCIAGLQHLPDSFCAIDGDVWQDGVQFRPVHRRPIGYVFQEPSLLPHLSVRRNLLYGAPKRAQAAIGFDEVVDLLGISALLDRSPHHLSGGERQRVAMGRALLSQPKLLLMDEPLAALDRATKNEILPFLERLHDRLSLPVIYISHDMAEIERFADHLVLMQGGVVTAAGTLHVLQSDPALPLAASRDAAVSLDGVTSFYDEHHGLLALRIEGGQLLVPAPPIAPGQRQRLRIAAGDVSLACSPPQASSILNILPARILSRSPQGNGDVTVVLGLGEHGSHARILARITSKSWSALGLREGMDVYAQIKAVSLEAASNHTITTSLPGEAGAEATHPPATVQNKDCSSPSERIRSQQRTAPMPVDFTEIDPNRVAAVLYRPKDDIDALLAGFAQNLRRRGAHIGGIVQRNTKSEAGCQVGMQAIDLLTGREISICQPLGSGAMACKLDAAGLAEAAVALSRAIEADVGLLVINKFSKQEASGQGLRAEFADAITAGIPVLTAVPEKCLDAWNTFTGGIGTMLLCEPEVIEGWWDDLSSRMARVRESRAAAGAASISRS